MGGEDDSMDGHVRGLRTKADKIRALGRAGYPRADIARYLGLRYQHVRNTLEAANIPMPNRRAEGDRVADHAAQVSGFAERSVALDSAADAADGYYPLKIGPDGALRVPEALRARMMLDPDGRVTAHVEDGELRMISPLAAIRRMQRIAQKYKKPGQSVVDEFLAERRALWGEE